MRHRVLTTFALLGLALQIAVPPGFMPSEAGSGWYLKWCPEGMSPAVMHALFGHAHHHHNDPEAPFRQCDLGGMTADADIPSIELTEVIRCKAETRGTFAKLSFAKTQVSPYLSRAPPKPFERRLIDAA